MTYTFSKVGSFLVTYHLTYLRDFLPLRRRELLHRCSWSTSFRQTYTRWFLSKRDQMRLSVSSNRVFQTLAVAISL